MQGLFFCPLRFTALQMCNFIIAWLEVVVEESQPQKKATTKQMCCVV
jgi:hypothetical protein